MRRQDPFDEVMIVNPSETNSDQRVRLMRFHNIYTPEVDGYGDPYGYYGQPEQMYGYGYTDPTYGYYGQPDQVYGYGQPEQVYGYGYYGQPEQIYGYGQPEQIYGYGQPEQVYGYGYYGQPEQVYGYGNPNYGYYGAAEPNSWDGYGYYGDYQPESVGYYADEYPVGEYAPDPTVTGYGHTPEMVGYGEPEPYAPAVSYYGNSDYSGYVRDVPPPFNAGCPVPTNVNGLDDAGFDGFVRPRTVNPTCEKFIEQPGSPTLAPDTFKPLW
jgi:hypothetical protein